MEEVFAISPDTLNDDRVGRALDAIAPKLKNTLILAGTADALVDPTGSRQLHEQSKSTSDLRMLEGRFHEPFNDIGSDEVFQLIADWLK